MKYTLYDIYIRKYMYLKIFVVNYLNHYLKCFQKFLLTSLVINNSYAPNIQLDISY